MTQKGQKRQDHPLRQYSEHEQIAYLSLLAALCYVDKDFSDHEKHQLDALLEQLNISDEGKAKVYSSVFSLEHAEKLSYFTIIQALEHTELKYTLISDLCFFAFADSHFSENEYQYIIETGAILDISKEQIDAIKSVQENLFRIKDIPSNSEKAKRILKESASKLAGVGVPVGAIAVSGSVFGLSAAGITSGLAALSALVGGGMLAGTVVVIPAIAVGSVYGVKKLFDVVWNDKDNKKETQLKTRKRRWPR